MSSTVAGALKSYEHVLTCLVRDLHSHSNDDDDTLDSVSGVYSNLGNKTPLWQQYGGSGTPLFFDFLCFCLNLVAAHGTSPDDFTGATNW